VLLTFQSRCFIVVAALLGATAVMLGAYASHGLASWASMQQVGYVQLAVKYQLFHTITLLMIALLSTFFPHRLLSISLWAFTLGTVCFSGSLYYLVFAGSPLLALITPLGGLLLITAWLCVAMSMFFKQK